MRASADPADRSGGGSGSPDRIRMRALGVRFGDFVAVEGVDLDVEDGEFLCTWVPRAAARPRCSTASRASSSRPPATSPSTVIR